MKQLELTRHMLAKLRRLGFSESEIARSIGMVNGVLDFMGSADKSRKVRGGAMYILLMTYMTPLEENTESYIG